MAIEYAHTNIVAHDWERLVEFYCQVFGCKQIGPMRDLGGEGIAQASGVKEAHLFGVHLLLPGAGDNGPTLEIYSYSEVVDASAPSANRQGFGHIAFRVDDVDSVLEMVIKHGGSKLGSPTISAVPNAGNVCWVYARDPEGNIVELQKWN